MKAVVINSFGGPENLSIQEVPTPVPGASEVRIRTAFAAVNPVDWKIREGYLKDLLPHQFPLIPGWDVSGEIDAVGAQVSEFKVGDQVFAYARKSIVQWGTYAEYVVLDKAVLAKIPKTLTLEQAAGVPLAGLTAWQALHQFSFSLSNKRVLIHGAAGGVGSFALQFAKALGAGVIATARANNLGYLKDLGADHLIDYEVQDVGVEVKRIFPEGIDFVLDTVGGKTLISSFPLLKKRGGIVSITERPNEELVKQYEVQFAYVFVTPNATDLREITKLFETKKIKMPEFQVFPLSQVKEAQELSQSGHVRGKIILDIKK